MLSSTPVQTVGCSQRPEKNQTFPKIVFKVFVLCSDLFSFSLCSLSLSLIQKQGKKSALMNQFHQKVTLETVLGASSSFFIYLTPSGLSCDLVAVQHVGS